MNDRSRTATACRLEAAGYAVTVDLRESPTSREHLDAVVELAVPPALGGWSLRSTPTFLSLADLRRLAAYFEEHVRRLRDAPDQDAPVYVPLELGFQVQALAGEVDDDEDGEFTLRWLVNVGRDPEEGTRVYAGAEAVVGVRQVREFAVSLEAVAAEAAWSR